MSKFSGSAPTWAYFKNLPSKAAPHWFHETSHARKGSDQRAWWPGHVPGGSMVHGEQTQRLYPTAQTYVGAGGWGGGQAFHYNAMTEGDKGIGDQTYRSPNYMWNADWVPKKRVGYDPQGIRHMNVEGGGSNLDQTYGGAGYLGPSYSAQLGKGKTLENTSVTAEDFDTLLSRLQQSYPDFWKRTEEDSLDPNVGIDSALAGLDWRDMRKHDAGELKSLIASEFGTKNVSVGEGANFDINPFKDSKQYDAFDVIQADRQAALGDLLTQHGGPQEVFDHLDTKFSASAFDSAGEGFDPLDEGANPMQYWGDWADQQVGTANRPQIIQDFISGIEDKAGDWHSARQDAIQTGVDIASKHREIADLERSKGEAAVDTRKGLLGNVLESEKRQYESGLAGMGTTPAEQLGVKQLLESGEIGLRGIKEGIQSEREGIEGMAAQKAWQEQVASNRADSLKDPFSIWQGIYGPAKEDYGPGWQTEEGSWWDDVMALVKSEGAI